MPRWLQYAGRSLPKMLAALSAAHVLLALLGTAPAAAAQSPPPNPPQPASDAKPAQPPPAAADDVIVVSASRREEQLLNAPATMTVLTDDLLSTAPGQNVTDLLRLVPGLNTIQTSARDVNVTSRGATSTLSDSMLVLLDGRSISQDFFGSVIWGC